MSSPKTIIEINARIETLKKNMPHFPVFLCDLLNCFLVLNGLLFMIPLMLVACIWGGIRTSWWWINEEIGL